MLFAKIFAFMSTISVALVPTKSTLFKRFAAVPIFALIFAELENVKVPCPAPAAATKIFRFAVSPVKFATELLFRVKAPEPAIEFLTVAVAPAASLHPQGQSWSLLWLSNCKARQTAPCWIHLRQSHQTNHLDPFPNPRYLPL